MQKLQCELCGGIDIQKTDDNMFQCRNCGCKYTPEQAKAMISGAVETTICDAEYNRLLTNVDTLMKLGNDDVLPVLDLMMHEYPDRYQGYWKYIQYFFFLIQKRKTVCFGSYTYKSKYDGLLHGVSFLSACHIYQSLLKVSEKDPGITAPEVQNLWNTSIRTVCQGLINGELDGLAELHSAAFCDAEIGVHPMLRQLDNEWQNNVALLKQQNICVHILSEEECEWFPASAMIKNAKHLMQPTFALNKRVQLFDYWCEVQFYRNIRSAQSFYPIKDHIADIQAEASRNAERVVSQERLCPNCHGTLHRSLLGRMKCAKCEFTSGMIG